MSLINQVLKDIDKRQAKKNVPTTLIDHVQEVKRSPQRQLALPVVAALAIGISGLGIYWVWGLQPKPTAREFATSTVSTPVPNTLVSPPPTAAQTEAAIAAPPLSPSVIAPSPLPATSPTARAPTVSPPPTRATSSAAIYSSAPSNETATPSPLSTPSVPPVVNKTPTAEQRSFDLTRQAQQQLRLNQVQQAQPLLEQALAIYPRNTEARQLLAHAQLQLNDLNAAITTLKYGLTLNSQPAEYHALLGALLQRKDQHAESVTHYVAALQSSPDNANWLVGIAISLQAQNMLPSAKEAYQRALDLGTLSPELASFAQRRLNQISR